MVHAYHLIFCSYGFWLPNDPRGSWSESVDAAHLRKFGPVIPANTRRSVARNPHDVALRLAAKEALVRPPVLFTGIEARAIGRGFADYVDKSKLVVWACAILPDHVHIVFARHRLDAETVAIQLKGAATKQLLKEKLHPCWTDRDEDGKVPHCWAKGEWPVFLNTAEEIRGRIIYVEGNPLKEGKPRQRWPFVVPFLGLD